MLGPAAWSVFTCSIFTCSIPCPPGSWPGWGCNKITKRIVQLCSVSSILIALDRAIVKQRGGYRRGWGSIRHAGERYDVIVRGAEIIDLLMGLFRGAVFRHGGGALKQPIKQPTETPTSTLALMGRFPSLMGRFPTLMGRFTDFVLRGRFTSWKSTGKQPIKKRGIKRFGVRRDTIPSSKCDNPTLSLGGTSAERSSHEAFYWVTNFLRSFCRPAGGTLSKNQKRWRQTGSLGRGFSEAGRIRFRGVRFQTPNSVSFSGLTEFRGANSVSSSQPIICVPKRTHRVFRRTHRVCPKTQWVLSSETVLSKQYSARFLVFRKTKIGVKFLFLGGARWK